MNDPYGNDLQTLFIYLFKRTKYLGINVNKGVKDIAHWKLQIIAERN